jgi:hypothetical protein
MRYGCIGYVMYMKNIHENYAAALRPAYKITVVKDKNTFLRFLKI